MSFTDIVQRLVAQDLAVLTAAIEIGQRQLKDATIHMYLSRLRDLIGGMTADHFLFVRVPGDDSTFFACGTPEGLADTIVEDGVVAYLLLADKATCPNCKGQ